ncbi:eukaryotic aspartyl protease, partial [Opisthorchis viverrini]
LDGYPVGPLVFSLLTIHSPNVRLPAIGDGYLGLGHPDVERTVTDFNILNVMSANQMIDYKRFTLFCVCAGHRNELEPDARIVFGSHNTINPGEFQMVSADVSRASWKIQVLSLGTPGRRISSRLSITTLDSTTWLSKASVDRARRINTALGATESGNLYVVNCNQVGQLPSLVITLQGVDLNLAPEQYIQREEVQGQQRCFSSIVPDPAIRTERMTLGMSFMQHFITMFDQQEKQVGFKPRVC